MNETIINGFNGTLISIDPKNPTVPVTLEGELYKGQKLSKGWTIKTNGNCEQIIVRNEDAFNEDGSKKRKIRRNSNITSKKKKRK